MPGGGGGGGKLYVAFKLHPQEGRLGPVVSPGAVGRSMEPQMAAKLLTGEVDTLRLQSTNLGNS